MKTRRLSSILYLVGLNHSKNLIMKSSTLLLKEFSNNSTHKVRKILNLNLTSFIDMQYTIEWQRRIFRKIGEYLRKHNVTI